MENCSMPATTSLRFAATTLAAFLLSAAAHAATLRWASPSPQVAFDGSGYNAFSVWTQYVPDRNQPLGDALHRLAVGGSRSDEQAMERRITGGWPPSRFAAMICAGIRSVEKARSRGTPGRIRFSSHHLQERR